MRHRQVHGLIINVPWVIKASSNSPGAIKLLGNKTDESKKVKKTTVNYMLVCHLRSKDLCAPLIFVANESDVFIINE